MDSALTIAATGLRTAERDFTRAASGTLAAALPSSTASSLAIAEPLDMATGIVAQMEASVSFKANLAVYRTANELYRTLLKATAS